MKFLLCSPNPSETHTNRRPALSIIYPGAALEKSGFNVDYWDASYQPESDLLNLVDNADVVGVTSMTGFQLKGAERIMRLARAKGKQVIMGGPHASLAPHETIKESFVDYILIGEGEKTLVKFARELEQGNEVNIHGIMSKNNFPGLASQMTEEEYIYPVTSQNEKYFQSSAREGNFGIQTSRNCPYKCAFCHNLNPNVPKYHYLPLEQIKMFKEQFPDLHDSVIVDDWLGAKKRIQTVSNALGEQHIKHSVNIRAGQVDEELVETLHKNGCYHVMFGIESGSPRMLKEVIQKGETVENFIKAAKAFKHHNIRRQFSFVLGMPGETDSEKHETYEFIDYMYRVQPGNVGIAIYNYVPFPGTPLLPAAIAEGFIPPTSLSGWSDLARNKSINKKVNENVFLVGGLTHHRSKNNRTDENFPGILRLLILPFELACRLRWKFKLWRFFEIEKFCINELLKWRTKKAMRKGLV